MSPALEQQSVLEIVSLYPETKAVFKRFGIPTENYKALEHENLTATAHVHAVEMDALVSALNAVIAG